MSSGTQTILPDHAQQVPKNTPVLVFSKLISTMIIKDVVKSETDDISWVVTVFCHNGPVLEKLIFNQLAKKFPSYHRTKRFIIVKFIQ